MFSFFRKPKTKKTKSQHKALLDKAFLFSKKDRKKSDEFYAKAHLVELEIQKNSKQMKTIKYSIIIIIIFSV